MNIDGYVLLRINEHDHNSNEGKAEIEDLVWVDQQLECLDIDNGDIVEQVVGQLPDELKDVLVMCFVNYAPNSYFNGESAEYEDCFQLVSHTVMQTNFKEFYRKRVTQELEVTGWLEVLTPDELAYYKNLVGEWEEFYDEDFIPSPSKKTEQVYRFGSTILGVDWGQGGDKAVMVNMEIDGDGKYIIKEIKEL